MSIQAAALYGLVSIAGADRAVRDLRSVSGEVDRTQGVLSGMSRNAGRIGRGMGEIGVGVARAATYVGAATIGLGAAAVKVGMDYQDAFAGVRKTVEGTPEELDSLYRSLQQLATRIPISFTDLAGIAQEAGALGVPTQQVDRFTEAVARTSAATVGLSREAASEAFGKLGNLLHLTADGYDRLGSSLVRLGNVGASTESDIIEVAKRFAGTGRAAGLSAPQILGWSSALASLGPEAEAAGSSLVRMFGRLIQHAGTGDAKFRAFAKTAGMSTEAFKALLGRDVNEGMTRFIAGLSKLDKFDLAKTLKLAGITNVRDIQAIQALSQNVGLLTYQVGQSSDAWQKNTDLTQVSERRFDTLKSHLLELRNTGLNAADSFAQGLSPAIDRVAQKAKAFVSIHTGDFERLGRDLGQAIDSIDWRRVESGARTFIDLLRTGYSIISKIPPEIDLIVAGLVAASKVPGVNLIERGAVDVVGGVAGLGKNLAQGVLRAGLSRIPVIGGTLAQAGATPVFVVNWPAGFGAAGAAGAVEGALTKSGGLAGLLRGALKIALPAGIAFELVQAFKSGQDQRMTEMTTGIGDAVARSIQQGGSDAQLRQELAALDTGISQLSRVGGPLNSLLYQGQIDALKAQRDALQAELDRRAAATYGGRNPNQTPDFSRLPFDTGKAGNLTPELSRLPEAVAAGAERGTRTGTAEGGKGQVRKIESVWEKVRESWQRLVARNPAVAAFQRDYARLRSGTGDIGAIADRLTMAFEKGIGGYGHGRGLEKGLTEAISAALAKGDTALAKSLAADLDRVRAKMPERAWVHGQLEKAQRILESNRSVHDKIAALQAIESRIEEKVHRGSSSIKGEIDDLQAIERRIAAKKTALSIKLLPTTYVSIDGRQVVRATTAVNQFSRGYY